MDAAARPSPGTPAEPSDGELVRRTRRGDSSAFDRLVRRYLKRTMAIAWEYTESREDAEDAVQEAFRRVLQALDRFDADRPFRPWLFTIVRNTALNVQERRSRWRPVAIPDTLPARSESPLDEAAAAETRGRLERALETLSDMQRRCFRLCALEELTSAEAAEALGIKEETVRTHVFRARKTLTTLMGPERKEGWTA